MTSTTPSGRSEGQFERLLGYLERDPNNAGLLTAAVASALAEGRPGEAEVLLYRQSKRAPLSPAHEYLRGIVLLRVGRYDEARAIFSALLAEAPADPTLSLNLAWALACRKDYAAAETVLTDAITREIAEAALLKVRMLHQLGRLDDALALGHDSLDAHADKTELLGALSEIALDLKDTTLAHQFAERAADNPEALSTIGLLFLIDDTPEAAAEAFDRALAGQPNNPRALLGKGLSRLARGDVEAAAADLDRSAALFDDHAGSWVASAWAYLLAGDYLTSRARFERALIIDADFAETQGGLAVLDIVQGDLASARRRTDAALRLDRRCLGGAFAKTMLLSASGQPHDAERVLQAALSTPIGPNGRTLVQAAVSLGRLTGRTRPRLADHLAARWV